MILQVGYGDVAEAAPNIVLYDWPKVFERVIFFLIGPCAISFGAKLENPAELGTGVSELLL